MIWLRSLLFYLGMGAATLLFAPVGIVLVAAPFRFRYRVMSCWAVFCLWWLGISCGLRHRVEGLENIPAGAGIILCKHQSAWETLALQLVFPAQAWVLKRELLRIPVYGWGLATLWPIAIDRGSGVRALRQIVAQGRERLEAGVWVVIFPEGTRVKPGERGRYQPGGGLLAAQSGFPVIPVAHNAGYFWPRNSFRKRPGLITLSIGPAIDPRGRRPEEITAAAERWIESRAAALAGVPAARG